MIEMAVGEDDGIGGFYIGGKVFVDSQSFVARALIEAHIEENPQSVRFEKVRGTRHGAVGAAELDAHGEESITRDRLALNRLGQRIEHQLRHICRYAASMFLAKRGASMRGEDRIPERRVRRSEARRGRSLARLTAI
jgi:hypothetical protein